MKWVIIILTLLLVSSCGLLSKKRSYKATSDSTYSLKQLENSKTLKRKKDFNVFEDKTLTLTNSSGKIRFYPRKGSEVRFDKEGNVIGSMDSIIQDLNTSSEQLNNLFKAVGKIEDQDSSASKATNIKEEKSQTIKEKEKEPDKGGLAITYSIISCLVVIVILIILRRR